MPKHLKFFYVCGGGELHEMHVWTIFNRWSWMRWDRTLFHIDEFLDTLKQARRREKAETDNTGGVWH